MAINYEKLEEREATNINVKIPDKAKKYWMAIKEMEQKQN